MAPSRFRFTALLFILLASTTWTPGLAVQVGGVEPVPTTKFPIDDLHPAPPKGKLNIDVVEVKHEAEELAKLAQEIPSDVEQANKGVVHKDLNDRLKRIEKLSKRLRRELSL